jgi:hypothetical protein
MKKILLLVCCFTCPLYIYAQDSAPDEDQGKITAKIYSNFKYGMKPGNRSTAFEIERAYFGFERRINKYFSANVKLDIGSPDDISEYSRLRRYAYFKNAGIQFRYAKITVNAGLFDMPQFKIQEKFWGYRYLYKSYMDEYKFGPSADIGLSAQYDFSNWISADLTISNGEGYTTPQRDETYKTGAGLTLQPVKNLTFRGYYAIFMHENPEMVISGFAGYQSKNLRIGAEFIYQKNYRFYSGHNRYGYSIYSTYVINESWEMFARYDQLYSNILTGDMIPWNLPEDGSALISGIQYTPASNIHITLDYQDWVEYAENGESNNLIYVHFEVVF